MVEQIKTAPNSKDSEAMVLGCMFNSTYNLSVGVDLLCDDDFYYDEHKIIFKVLKQAYKNDQPGDIHIITQELIRQDNLKKIGGASYLTTVSQYAGTSANVSEYCKDLLDKSFSRKALEIHQKAITEFAKDPKNPSKIAEKHQRQLIELGKRHSPSDKASIGEILSGNKSRVDPTPLIERLKTRQEFYKEHGKPFMTGLPTGFIDFDKKAIVLEDTNLIVVAGRPGMGKTAFALAILANICFDQNLPVGFISLEMGADQLTERLLSMKSYVSGEKVKRGTFDDKEFKKLQEVEEELKKARFFIHDQAVSTVSQVISRARRLKDEEDIRILAIDYLQLLGTDSGNDSRQYEVGEVSRALKQLAMELKIPVIVVAQLSRKVEERKDKRPLMSDLRDSGQIEQDADSIICVYREGYYNKNHKKTDTEIILLKNRHGPETSTILSFLPECGAFGNLSFSPLSEPLKEEHIRGNNIQIGESYKANEFNPGEKIKRKNH